MTDPSEIQMRKLTKSKAEVYFRQHLFVQILQRIASPKLRPTHRHTMQELIAKQRLQGRATRLFRKCFASFFAKNPSGCFCASHKGYT